MRERLDHWSEGWLAATGGGEIREVERREKKIKIKIPQKVNRPKCPYWLK